MKLRILITAICLFVPALLLAQVTVDLTIANQTVAGTNFSFDIFLTRTGSNDLYLSTADFILTFNNANFTSPGISVGAASTFTLKSTTNADVGANYRNALSVGIAGNEIQINLNLVTFGPDQAGFDASVAKITNAPNTFKFGTYTISGISNPAGSMGLAWKSGLSGTDVESYNNANPWNSSPAAANLINPGDQPLPIQLASFATTSVSQKSVTLSWSTLSETNNYGFEVQRSASKTTGFTTIPGSFTKGNGTTAVQHTYSYTDAAPAPGQPFYRLRQLDLNNAEHFSDVLNVTGAASANLIPTDFAMRQNYPNPFNPTTMIEFDLPKDSHVSLELYNILGQKVMSVLNEIRLAGTQRVQLDASRLATGVYLYRLAAGDKVFMKKMTLIK
jgi:hypothetical protein